LSNKGVMYNPVTGQIDTTYNPGTVTVKGNYSVSGDKVYCTNVRYSYKEKTGDGSRDYTDKASNDEVWPFYFSEKPAFGNWTGYTWLYIDTPARTTTADGYSAFVKPSV